MKIAIIYKSQTGNTRLLAETIRSYSEEKGNEVIYCGEPGEQTECFDADMYFVGSWTDKGTCCAEIADFLQTAEHKKIAFFGTAGFGGSKEYYDTLFERIRTNISASNEIKEQFFCQGKMPIGVRKRYEGMLAEQPGDARLEASIRNFDQALSHPDDEDLEHVKEWAEKVTG